MQPQLLRSAVARLRARRRTSQLQLEARTMSTGLAWGPPATIISLAGVHGGAGTSTLCLLLAEAIATLGEGPALAVDLAGRSRGGLAVLGGAAGQTTAEGTCAVAAIHGGRLERPFGVNEDGVRIIGARPDGVEELDRSHETLVARLVEAAREGADDARLGELARSGVGEGRSWQALRWDNEQVVAAVARVLDQAAVHHALVAVDLGMLDGDLLADMVGARSDLHVWVVPGRAAAVEIAERRLPLIPFEPAGGEAIAVWQADGSPPSAKRLSALGDLRGCPVVRIANHGDPGDDVAIRMHRCLSGITELCELAR
jgi:hypothetical protein